MASTSTVSSDVPELQNSPNSTPTPEPLEARPTDTIVISNPPSGSLRPSLSWKSFRSSLSISEKTSAQLGWAVAFLSVLLTIIALSPAFKSQNMSEKALKLAEWTALKDYVEECREELAAGIESKACLRAMDVKIPPPPYVKPGILDKLRRSFVHVQLEHNGTSGSLPTVQGEIHVPGVIQAIVFLAVILTACVFLFLSFENSRARLRRASYTDHTVHMEEERLLPPVPLTQEHEATTTTTIRHPPNHNQTTLRRRTVRTHPIYRHANLEEALHHDDLAEIRLRLQNGEDVNQHWPYLIYKLAITPPTVDTPKRIEVARLCLDFGADVNALKGWNGQSALMIAIHFGNVDVAKLLITNGATVGYSPPDSNLTALHRCVRLAVTGVASDAFEIMNMLFDYGADPNQVDRAGETALHKLLIDAWLKRDNEVKMRKLAPIALCLIEHGARIPDTIKDRYLIGNPLWDAMRSALLGIEWSKQVRADPTQQWQSWL